MDKFEAFLVALLKRLFRESPYDKDKAKKTFEAIRQKQSIIKSEGENYETNE